jgi:cell division septum initiation protein DivIVA
MSTAYICENVVRNYGQLFKIERRGMTKDEVLTFVTNLIDVCDDLTKENAALKTEVASLRNAQQRYAKIAAELEQCAVDMNTDKLIPIVTCLNQWARLLRQ